MSPAPRMAAIVEFIDDDRRRARVLYVEALGNEALAAHRRELGSRPRLTRSKSRAIEAAGSWPSGEHVGQVGAAMLVGGISEVLRDWIDGRVKATRDQLIDDLAVLGVALGQATEQIARSRPSRRPRR